MSDKNSEFYDNFTKDIFENIKSLSHDERSEYIINTYANLFGKLKAAENAGTVNVDMKKLRSELGQIRGIGGQRLDEIMAVIERNIFGDTGSTGKTDLGGENTDNENFDITDPEQ